MRQKPQDLDITPCQKQARFDLNCITLVAATAAIAKKQLVTPKKIL
jgi:hypothetical protein